MEVLQRLQQGHGNLQNHPALAHGAPLIQQAVQEVSPSAVLHDQKDLVRILERPVELRDQRHPAKKDDALSHLPIASWAWNALCYQRRSVEQAQQWGYLR